MEPADKMRQKYGLKGSMDGIYERVVAFGTLHKRIFNWNDWTFYMSAEHAQVVAGPPKRGAQTRCRWRASRPQGDSLNNKAATADLERMRQGMEAVKIIIGPLLSLTGCCTSMVCSTSRRFVMSLRWSCNRNLRP